MNISLICAVCYTIQPRDVPKEFQISQGRLVKVVRLRLDVKVVMSTHLLHCLQSSSRIFSGGERERLTTSSLTIWLTAFCP
jgi:hypothetical protein